MGIPNMSLPELRPVQTENPMDQYAKALQIRAMGQQSQLTALQTQQQQQALKDQQAGTQALHEWDGQDPEQLTKLMAKNGASINAVLATKQHFLETKAKYSAIAKDDAETGAKNLQILKDKNDNIVGRLNAVYSLPDEQLVPGLQQAAQELVQQGLLDPQHAQVAAQLAQSGDPAKIRQSLKLFEKSYMSDSQQLDDAKKAADTANAAAELPGKVADSAIKTAEADQMKQGALPQNLADMKYRTLQQNIASGQPIGAGDKAFIKAYEKQKLLVPAFNFSLNNGGLGGNGNGQPSPLAQAVASGQMKIQDVLTNRTPPSIRQKFLAEVMQINPQFKSYDYDVAKGVEKSFTSGADEKNLNAINTARYHLKTFGEAAAALDNGDVQGLNKIAQAFGTQFGGDKASNFNVVKDALAGELGKAFAGANVAEGDRTRLLEQISKASSPAQLKGFAEMADKLLEGKQKQMQQTYEAGKKGQPNFGNQGGGKISVTAPDGSVHPFDTQAQADAFKKLAGIK